MAMVLFGSAGRSIARGTALVESVPQPGRICYRRCPGQIRFGGVIECDPRYHHSPDTDHSHSPAVPRGLVIRTARQEQRNKNNHPEHYRVQENAANSNKTLLYNAVSNQVEGLGLVVVGRGMVCPGRGGGRLGG